MREARILYKFSFRVSRAVNSCVYVAVTLESKSWNMINRNAARVAATLIFLGGWSQASSAAPIGDVGVSCASREGNALYCRSPKVDVSFDLTRGSGACGGQTIRTASSAVFLTAFMKTRSAQRNLCPKSNAFAPALYF